MLGFTFSVGDIHGRSTFSIEQDKSRSKVGGFDTIFSVVQTGPKSNLQSTQSIQSIWYQELCTPWHFIPTIYIYHYIYIYSILSHHVRRKGRYSSHHQAHQKTMCPLGSHRECCTQGYIVTELGGALLDHPSITLKETEDYKKIRPKIIKYKLKIMVSFQTAMTSLQHLYVQS